jgi:glucose/arabinose dehydrogenase
MVTGVRDLLLIICFVLCGVVARGEEPPVEQSDYYRVETYELPKGLILEASGLAVLPDGKLAVAIRRGEVWILQHPSAEPPTAEAVGYKLFASGMHELLGLAYHEGDLYVTQRSEVTRLRDIDGDGVADEYRCVSHGWGVSGAYHEYAYGPVFDRDGNMHNTLNCSMGKKWEGAGAEAKETLWRGWSVITPKGGGIAQGFSAGFRSPIGIGLNAEGDIFGTDQQGNWMGTNPLMHIRKGAFFGHADALADAKRPDSPVKHPGKLPDGITIAEAIKQVPGYCPPAVWFPYVKMGQSTTGMRCDKTGGKFGPFKKQMFVGEFVLSGVNRVFLEKVGGEYQGACFPFVNGLQSAVLTLDFLEDGSMVVGQSNRGWNSSGNRPFGLQRIVPTGKTPLEVEKMEALKEGFRFTFTQPLDEKSLGEFSGQTYTYTFTGKYGSPEIDSKPLVFRKGELSADGRVIDVRCEEMREGYVHEVRLPVLRSKTSLPLWHRDAYYTLNKRPEK